MFFGIGDVSVNLSHKSNLIQNEWEFGTILDSHSWYKFQWVLTVESLDVRVVVTAETAAQAPKEIVVSCLLAGLKKVTDHWIYDAACARMETQLGFAVDRWISPEIANVDVVEYDSEGASYEVSLIPVLWQTLVGEPLLTAHLHEDKFQVELEMSLKVNGQVFKSSVSFDRELWEYNQSECMNVGKFKLVSALYEYKPEMSHLWTQIRYNWFNMKDVSPETVSWYNSIQGNALVTEKKFHNPAADVHPMKSAKMHGEDNRVRELPALNEIVTNPVTGHKASLKRVIISLNDGSKWTREEIADWLETLDIDISFKVKTDDQ